MIFMGRFRIVNEARKEFEWIKETYLCDSDKLNELVDLRNYLKETFLLNEETREEYPTLQEELTVLVSEIDKCWWQLFTKGRAG